MTLSIKYVLFAILATGINIGTEKELYGAEYLGSGIFCVSTVGTDEEARRLEPPCTDCKVDPVVWEGEGVRPSPIWINND